MSRQAPFLGWMRILPQSVGIGGPRCPAPITRTAGLFGTSGGLSVQWVRPRMRPTDSAGWRCDCLRRVGVVSREQILINGVPTRIHGSFERTVQDDAARRWPRWRPSSSSAAAPEQAVPAADQPRDGPARLPGRPDAGHDGDPGGQPHGGRQRRRREHGLPPRHHLPGAARVLPEADRRGSVEGGRHGTSGAPALAASCGARAHPSLSATSPMSRPGGILRIWAEAIRQLKGHAPRPKAPEETLTLPEMAGNRDRAGQLADSRR